MPQTEPRTPLVSVIIPCFNKAEFVGETLESVLVQREVDLEVVVVDDASTDGSWDIVARFGSRVQAHRLPENRGGPHARNRGARVARGHFLMFLDADDLLLPGTLAALAGVLADGTTDQFAACRWHPMRREGGAWAVYDNGIPLLPPGGDAVSAWLGNWYFPPCAVLWPRALYASTGGWDEELRAWQDTDIMIRALLRGAGIRVAGSGEARYRVHREGSVSKTVSEPAVRSRVRVLDKVAAEAEGQGVLSQYRGAIGRAYYNLAYTSAQPYAAIKLECLREADRYLGRAPFCGSPVHRALWRVLGLERKERLTAWVASQGLVRRTADVA